MKQDMKAMLRTTACVASLVVAVAAHAETQIKVGSTVYSDFSGAIAAGAPPAAGTAVWLNADDVAANTNIRATQRSLGYREVDYKAVFSASLAFTQVAASAIGGNSVYDYSAQANKNVDLVGFWKSKDLPIIIGPDGKAYITDGHHTTAGYLAAAIAPREVVVGNNHVVLGHVVANYYNPAAPVAPDDAWWLARASENNALLNGPQGNLLTQPGDANYATTRPILPSTIPMPTVPGKSSMTDSAMRSVTWGMADGITNGKKGYSKTNSLSPLDPQPDINFVEFFWADFLQNRVVFDNTQSGSLLGSGQPDANLIAAPISFYAAVANGTALAKSEVYRDQYGRSLNDYNNASYGANTQTWAGASLKNGLAKASDVYELYSLDGARINGDITPSAKSTNHLHIDTVDGQVIDGKIQNVASVDINRGSSINITWKDATLQPYNSTVTTAPGTGKVVFTAHNSYAGVTNIGAGTLEVASTGSIDNSATVTVYAGATLINNGVIGGGVVDNGTIGGSGVFNALTTVNAGGHLAPGNSPGTITFANGLTLNDGATLDLDLGTLSDLVLVTGGLLTGSDTSGVTVNIIPRSGFKAGSSYTLIDWSGASATGVDAGDFTLANLPAWATAHFSIDGSVLNLAIGGVPEPETYAMMIAGFGLLGGLVRRRRNVIA